MSGGGDDLRIEGARASASLAWIAGGAIALLTIALGIVWHRAEEIEKNLSTRIGENHTEAQVKDGEHDRAIGELQKNQAAASVISAVQLQTDIQAIKVDVATIRTQLNLSEHRGRGD